MASRATSRPTRRRCGCTHRPRSSRTALSTSPKPRRGSPNTCTSSRCSQTASMTIRPIQPHSSSIGLKGRSQAKASSNRRDAERGRRRTRSWVRLQAPPGIGAVQTLHSRQHLTVGLDGTVEMWAEDESAGPYSQNGRHEDAAAERSKPQPVQTAPQPGSMEWFEAQNKKG